MNDLSRRGFLKVSVLVGAAASGCARLPEDEPAIATALTAEFELADNAVDYSPYIEGCDVYALGGRVHDADGQGLADVPIHISYGLSDLETTVRTAEDGSFLVEVVGDMSAGATYYVQMLDPANLERTMSDIITVEAIPDCDLNQMTMTFVPTQN
jgi:hypothetical protein